MASYLSIIEKTDKLIEHLQESFMTYSGNNEIHLWLDSVPYRSLYNLCNGDENQKSNLREHAPSPFSQTNPFRRALSSLLLADVSTPESYEEKEAIELFIDRLHCTIRDNNHRGIGNRRAHILYIIASRLNQTHGVYGSQTPPQRDLRLVHELPDVIKGCAENDPVCGVEYASYPLTACQLPKETSDRLFDVLIACSNEVVGNETSTQVMIRNTVMSLQYCSAFLHHDEPRSSRLTCVWKSGIDALYLFDQQQALTLVDHAKDSSAPAHPSIRQAARTLPQNYYRAPVSPAQGSPTPSALHLTLGSGAEN